MTFEQQNNMQDQNEILNHARQHLKQLIKIQAHARGFLVQRKFRKRLLELVDEKNNNKNSDRNGPQIVGNLFPYNTFYSHLTQD